MSVTYSGPIHIGPKLAASMLEDYFLKLYNSYLKYVNQNITLVFKDQEHRGICTGLDLVYNNENPKAITLRFLSLALGAKSLYDWSFSMMYIATIEPTGTIMTAEVLETSSVDIDVVTELLLHSDEEVREYAVEAFGQTTGVDMQIPDPAVDNTDSTYFNEQLVRVKVLQETEHPVDLSEAIQKSKRIKRQKTTL